MQYNDRKDSEKVNPQSISQVSLKYKMHIARKNGPTAIWYQVYTSQRITKPKRQNKMEVYHKPQVNLIVLYYQEPKKQTVDYLFKFLTLKKQEGPCALGCSPEND